MTIDKNLLGNKRKALNTLATAADTGDTAMGVGTFGTGLSTISETGQLTVTSRVAGTAGNGITVTAINIDTGLGTVLVVDGAITVEITDAATTAAQVALWINGDYLASVLVIAEATTGGAMGLGDAATIAGGADTVLYTLDIGSEVLSDANFTLAQRDPSLHAAQQLLGDGINILNQRAVGTATDDQHIIKYPQVAVATWGFGDGATVGVSYDLMGGKNLIPARAMIRNVWVDVVTAITSNGSDDATVTFNLKTATTALTTALDKNTSVAPLLGVPDHATATDWIKTTAADSIEVAIGGTEDPQTIATGFIKIFIEYMLCDVDPTV